MSGMAYERLQTGKIKLDLGGTPLHKNRIHRLICLKPKALLQNEVSLLGRARFFYQKYSLTLLHYIVPSSLKEIMQDE